MTTARTLQASLMQQALALSLAAVATSGVLAAVMAQAGSDRSTALAQQWRAVPQAVMTVPLVPKA